jgi:ribosome biogenesis GTPase A/23S rRNA maturation mini-RNase III
MSIPAFEGFFTLRDEVIAALGGLDVVAAALGAKTLRDRIARELVQKLREDRFHLVVVGEFNHGKTTFVNALLGAPALPVGVTPTTAAIHQIRYAERPEAYVVDAKGGRRAIPFEDAVRFTVGGDFTVGDDALTSDVDYLDIGFPAPLLRERILLVDTPGVNDLSLQRADITYSYIPRADAVLFLLDAGQILKESERVFLSEKLLKGSRDKIIFVITKWDLLAPDEQEQALAYAQKHLSSLVTRPVVFPVSADLALHGSRAASGLPELVGHLTRFLAEERGTIMLRNALSEGLAAADLLARGLDARRRALQMNADEIERRIAALEKDLVGSAGTIEQRRSQIREEVAALKVGARKDLDRFVADVCHRIPDVIDSAKPQDLKEYLPAFLEDAFRQWAEAETREIAAQLEQLAEKTVALVRDDARDSARRVAETLSSDARKLDVHVDTIKYDVGVVALMFGGMALMAVNLMAGGLLAIAGPAIFAMFARGRVHEEVKKRAKELAPEVMRDTAAKVGPKLEELVDVFVAKLDAWVVGAGEELQREVVEVLAATRQAKAGGAHDDAKEAADVDAQAAHLASVTGRLAELRESLAD